jgi:hypothetical protein
MNLLKEKRLVVFGASVIAGLAFGSPKQADALSTYRRMNGTSCQVGTAGNYGGTLYNFNGMMGNSGASTTSFDVMCPYNDDSTVPKGSIDGLYIDMDNFTTTPTTVYPYAYACVAPYDDSTGAACGQEKDAKAAGWNSMNMDLTAWRNSSYSAWYPFLSLVMPGKTYINGYLVN